LRWHSCYPPVGRQVLPKCRASDMIACNQPDSLGCNRKSHPPVHVHSNFAQLQPCLLDCSTRSFSVGTTSNGMATRKGSFLSLKAASRPNPHTDITLTYIFVANWNPPSGPGTSLPNFAPSAMSASSSRMK